VIAFRQVDARWPFLWEDASQPAARWHADGEGPAHYFADTPDGAWAEFLRHEEITEASDLATVRRQMWAVEIGDVPDEPIDLPPAVLTGGRESYTRCQQEARDRRARGTQRLTAKSAALVDGGAHGFRIRHGVQPASARDGRTIVVFGAPDEFVGWIAADRGQPAVDLLLRVRHFDPSSRRAIRAPRSKGGRRDRT